MKLLKMAKDQSSSQNVDSITFKNMLDFGINMMNVLFIQHALFKKIKIDFWIHESILNNLIQIDFFLTQPYRETVTESWLGQYSLNDAEFTHMPSGLGVHLWWFHRERVPVYRRVLQPRNQPVDSDLPHEQQAERGGGHRLWRAGLCGERGRRGRCCLENVNFVWVFCGDGKPSFSQ